MVVCGRSAAVPTFHLPVWKQGVLFLKRRERTVPLSAHGWVPRKPAGNPFSGWGSALLKTVKEKVFPAAVLLLFVGGLGLVFPGSAQSDSSVKVVNETGYVLEVVKYVREIGDKKSLAGNTLNLAKGGSCIFPLKEGGTYRVYASFDTGGKKIYAKGTAYTLRDGGRYTLTLKKVVIQEGGASLQFINQTEFDAIK